MKASITVIKALASIVVKRATAAISLGFFLVVKFLTETITTQDTATKSVTKKEDNNALVTDSVISETEKPTSDTSSLTDGVVKTAEKSTTDNPSFLDTQVASSTKSLSESPSVSDVIGQQITKPLSDSLSVTDDTNGTSADDDANLQIVKVQSTAFLITDAHSLTPLKAANDTPSFQDAGAILNQGYCENFYFADDYIGTTTSF